MKLDSPLFNRIRVKPEQERKPAGAMPACQWPGCDGEATHRAPKGRLRENQYWRFCLEHVREYNQSYNFFAGMSDDAVAKYQKEAITGHRPTWKLGQNASTMNANGRRARPGSFRDPFNLLGEGGEPGKATSNARPIRNAELKALHTLGLDETASKEKVRTQYKTLVKRLHPDANNGSRANEDTLKAVIQAYDYLRSTGFC